MPRLEVLSEVQRRMLEFFPCMEFDNTPWTPLSKPLSESRAAIVTTAALHLRGDQPFNRDHPRRIHLPHHPQRCRPGRHRAEPLQHRL